MRGILRLLVSRIREPVDNECIQDFSFTNVSSSMLRDATFWACGFTFKTVWLNPPIVLILALSISKTDTNGPKSAKQRPGTGSRAPDFNGAPDLMRSYGMLVRMTARSMCVVCITSARARGVRCL